MAKKSLFIGIILISLLGLAGVLFVSPDQALADIAISGELGDQTGQITIVTPDDIAISDEVSNQTGSGNTGDEGSFVTEDDDNGGGGGGGGSRRRRPVPPQILGTTTVCVYPYLTKYIKYGQPNDPVEVTKLQRFLRDFQGFTTVSVTGVYDEPTLTAVMAFQRRYGEDVLNPWGLTAEQPTGYVFITTSLVINRLYCGYTTKHDLDLRNVYNNYSAPGATLPRAGEGGVDLSQATSTLDDVSGEGSVDGSQTAAVGFLDFLKDNLWFWLIPLLILILILAGYYLWPDKNDSEPPYSEDDYAEGAGEDEIYGEEEGGNTPKNLPR